MLVSLVSFHTLKKSPSVHVPRVWGLGYSLLLHNVLLYMSVTLGHFSLPLHVVVQYVCYQLYIQFSVDCTRAHVLDLDSSSPEKFSRHLVFHLPQAVFRNTTHTGKAHRNDQE